VKSAAGIVCNVVLPTENKSPAGLYVSGPGDRVGTVFNNSEVDTA